MHASSEPHTSMAAGTTATCCTDSTRWVLSPADTLLDQVQQTERSVEALMTPHTTTPRHPCGSGYTLVQREPLTPSLQGLCSTELDS